MKQLVMLLICLILIPQISAQDIKSLDVSPLDLAVFRPDGQTAKPVARIIYSRPQKNGRDIFGGIVPYGKLWRTGANQSTELNLYKDIIIEGKPLKAGNYTIYSIPGEREWTIIFNSNLYTWGAFDYDSSKNILEFKVSVKLVTNSREAFGIAFSGKDGKGSLVLAWDTTEIYINLNY
jgi:hypothetical protein